MQIFVYYYFSNIEGSSLQIFFCHQIDCVKVLSPKCPALVNRKSVRLYNCKINPKRSFVSEHLPHLPYTHQILKLTGLISDLMSTYWFPISWVFIDFRSYEYILILDLMSIYWFSISWVFIDFLSHKYFLWERTSRKKKVENSLSKLLSKIRNRHTNYFRLKQNLFKHRIKFVFPLDISHRKYIVYF